MLVIVVAALLSLEDQIRSTSLKSFAVAATGDDDGSSGGGVTRSDIITIKRQLMIGENGNTMSKENVFLPGIAVSTITQQRTDLLLT